MNNTDVIIGINNIDDLRKITDQTKYINISIFDFDYNIINYFINYGQHYSYSDNMNSKYGYIYVDYDTFKAGEELISKIVNSIPDNFNELEKIRYIYITLGKLLSMDINTMSKKNECISLNDFSIINNVWGLMMRKKVFSNSLAKLFTYICSRIGIGCEIVSNSINGNIANKIYIDNYFLIIDLASDLHNIQGGFATEHFDKYNDDIDMDKKVLYVKNNYTNSYIDKVLKKIDYTKEDVVYDILSLTEKILPINAIGVVELAKIYDNLFKKYCPNYEVKINNFFLCNNEGGKEHFILISYNDKLYSYNYSKSTFVLVNHSELIDNMKAKKIGIYDGEEFNMKERGYIL